MSARQINSSLDFLRDVYREGSKLWWRFFDWLAVVEWRQLALTWFLAFLVCVPLNMDQVAAWYFIASFGVKILAGGKRKADLVAKEATAQANVATLERRLMEAQMAA